MSRGRNRKHVRLGALSLTLGGAAFALIEILQASVGQFNPRPVVSVLVAVCVALLGSTVGRLRQGSVEAQQLTELLRVWPLRRIGDIDGLVFGVFPARRSSAVADLPPYVPRDIDPQLDDGLRAGGFVLVVGPPRSGKSRTAFEAARRVLGDRAAMIPVDGSALSALVDEELSGFGADAVWWLDDLERFVDHIGGTELAVLLGRGLTVVATVREERWDEMLHADGDGGERGRRLRGAATVFSLASGLSDAEAVLAADRLEHENIDLSAGIGAALAAAGDGAVSRRRAQTRPARRRPDDVLVLAAVSTLLTAAALGLVVAAGGFARRTPPPLGQQVDAIRQQAAAAGESIVYVSAQQLHGFDQTSYVFILRPSVRGSDELRIYDLVDGWLKLRLDFQPHTHGSRTAGAARLLKGLDAGGVAGSDDSEFLASTVDQGVEDFQLEGLQLPDLFNNGERELVADYTTTGPEGDQGPELPLIVWWDDLAQRYELRALVERRPPPSPDRHWGGTWPAPYILRDIGNGTELRGYPVDGYMTISEAGPYPPTLVVADSTYTDTQFGVAVSQYSMFWSAGRLHLVNPNPGCDTTLVVNQDLSLDRIMRAAIGLAPQQLSTVHVSCTQVANPPDGSG
jgi:hypothetical protein